MASIYVYNLTWNSLPITVNNGAETVVGGASGVPPYTPAQTGVPFSGSPAAGTFGPGPNFLTVMDEALGPWNVVVVCPERPNDCCLYLAQREAFLFDAQGALLGQW
ncbi:MAG TPA: hypothetical protein VN706_19460 [Gemmatimonadaceae bacterium]|nr:hypothetical protein [Gemmatimonadaceae bacterium]